ncbi:hypothetical protein MP228_003438 [Amoeboaphelidium protococcarum]|nr:hypothetical protein MP228_003438 [Amoeboaphelidium protococcarum]
MQETDHNRFNLLTDQTVVQENISNSDEGNTQSCNEKHSVDSDNSTAMSQSAMKKQRQKQKRNVRHEGQQRQRSRELLGKCLQQQLEKSRGNWNYNILVLLEQIALDIQAFVKSPSSGEQMTLPPMKSHKVRDLFRQLCEQEYKLTVSTRGRDTSKSLVVYKTSLTCAGDEDSFRRVLLSGFNVDIVRVKQNYLLNAQSGSAVDAHAEPLNELNVGFRLLREMGFDPDAIETHQGTASAGVVVNVKNDRLGLGSARK